MKLLPLDGIDTSFVWRALLDRFPMRWNLSRKGVEVASLLCPICSFSMEVSDHVFVSCELPVSIWKRIFVGLI